MNEPRENSRFDPESFIPDGVQGVAAVPCEVEEAPRALLWRR